MVRGLDHLHQDIIIVQRNKMRRIEKMSYFLFGTFDALKDETIIQRVKTYTKEKGIYIWFDKEITFYKEIQRMLMEQNSKGSIMFAITSKNQPCNSSDVLFPFDKFTNDALFEDESREFYKKCCRDNIDILFDCLNKTIDSFNFRQGEIFVVEGYDDNFQKKKCNVDEMKKDLLLQIEDKVSVDSCIYYVRTK